ncbi:MAG: winged helix-turn-helix transcriptional regulator [Clostridia bacterium]|nr:winged helix-turn-helix transcriptional regulator [Clostridia bacterium]
MDQDLQTKIAFWYYTCGITQDEIAKRLKLTRQKVNSIIGSLKEDGIVAISIRGCERKHLEWEHLLEQRYHLQQVIITPDYGSEELSFFKVANAAAQYLEQSISDGNTIGVSWGRTLAAAVGEMRFLKKSECRVMQLMGVQSMDGFPMKSDDIVRSLSVKLDCPSFMLYAPVLVSDPKTKELLLNEKSIRCSMEAMEQCQIGLFGIGVLNEDAPMCQMGYLSKEDVRQLNEQGFCADIAMNPIRQDGTTDGCFLENRIINASPQCIRRMENAIGIASGPQKANAVLAVLRAGLLNTLIIDCGLAEKIIKIMEEPS